MFLLEKSVFIREREWSNWTKIGSDKLLYLKKEETKENSMWWFPSWTVSTCFSWMARSLIIKDKKEKTKKHLCIITKAEDEILQGILRQDEACLQNIIRRLALEAKEV